MTGRRGPSGPPSGRRGANSESLEALGRQIDSGGAAANAEGLLGLGRAIDGKGARGSTRRRRRRRTSRIVMFSVLGLVIMMVAVSAGGYVYGYFQYKKILNPTLCEGGSAKNINVCVAELDGKPFNVLAIGSDSRNGLPAADDKYFGGPGAVDGQRSDVVKVFHVDPNAGTISVVSFPRDTMVTLLANQALYGRFNRINVNYEKGPGLLVQTIEANFGIPINHVVQVGFGGLANAVNALGGIYLHFPYPALDHYSSLHIPHTGCLRLNGFQALAVARSRHYEYYTNHQWNYDGSSDYGRIDRQNQFLRALVSRAKQQYNPATIAAFINTLPQGVQIDSTFGYNELLGLAGKFHSFNPATMAAYTLPTYSAVNPTVGDVLYVDQPAAQTLLVKVFGQVGTKGGLIEPTNPPPNSALLTPLPPAVATPKPPPPTTTTTSHGTTTTRPPVTTTTAPLHTESWYTFNPIACTPR